MSLFNVHPVGKQYRVSQAWGERPDYYKQFSCSGVALRGHNGVDFATPVGTPVYSVAPGIVLETGYDAAGYGRYVKMRHEWGESLYAHLDGFSVATGATIAHHVQVGRSGNTGNSTGPHLHFAIRISPYYRDDGWCGFSDPTYHLRVLEQKPLAYLGVQFQRQGVQQYLSDLERLQPSAVLLIDPSVEDVSALRQVCPWTAIVARIYRPDQEISEAILSNPAGAASWMHDISLGNDAVRQGMVDYVQVPNEVCQWWHQLESLRDAEMGRMRLAERDGLFRCAVLGTSVGNLHMPEEDRMAYWRVMYPVFEQCEQVGHMVLVHQYGAPDMWGPKNIYGQDASKWLAERWQYQVYPRLPFRDGLRVFVGEFGIDGLLFPQSTHAQSDGEPMDPAVDILETKPKMLGYDDAAARSTGPCGWQCYTNAEDYAAQLISMAEHHERWSGQVVGATVFLAHAASPWETYDIGGEVLRLLADHYQKGEVPSQSLDELLIREGEAAQVIQFNPDAALQKAIFAAGFVPNSGEFDVTFDGIRYVAQRAESLASGEVRIYHAPVGSWGNVQYVVRP